MKIPFPDRGAMERAGARSSLAREDDKALSALSAGVDPSGYLSGHCKSGEGWGLRGVGRGKRVRAGRLGYARTGKWEAAEVGFVVSHP